MTQSSIPRFHLYGEAEAADAQAGADHFIHVETIAARSGIDAWTIRPHWHAALDHLLIVESGGGELFVEGESGGFAGGILIVPAATVHGFRFHPGTEGHVVTVAEPLMRRLGRLYPPLGRLRQSVRVLPMPDPAAIGPLVARLLADTARMEPLAVAAGEALLQLLLVEACRLLPGAAAHSTAPRREAALVARFRQQVDAHLGEGWGVATHARALGTSVARLRAACVAVAGEPPIRLVQDRLIAEARRQLAYTDRSVAEIGYDLGFADPAYFSRFFRRSVGQPPAAWRWRDQGKGSTDGGR